MKPSTSGIRVLIFCFQFILQLAVAYHHHCDGQPIGHSTCLVYNDKASCEANEEICSWQQGLLGGGNCLVYSECLLPSDKEWCLQGHHCGWDGSCFVADPADHGSCILIRNESVCNTQNGCIWYSKSDKTPQIIAIVAVVVFAIVAVGLVILCYCRCFKQRRRRVEEDATKTMSSRNTKNNENTSKYGGAVTRGQRETTVTKSESLP